MNPTISSAKATLFLALLVGACSALPGGKSADGHKGPALELDRLQVGSVYGVGSRFSSDDIDFTVEAFGEGHGNAEVSLAAALPGSAPHEGKKALRLSHATLQFKTRDLGHMEFDFVDNGGPVALGIGGETLSGTSFIALSGSKIGTARIEVQESSTAGVRHGRVIVSGSLPQVTISGSNLVLADLRLARGD